VAVAACEEAIDVAEGSGVVVEAVVAAVVVAAAEIDGDCVADCHFRILMEARSAVAVGGNRNSLPAESEEVVELRTDSACVDTACFALNGSELSPVEMNQMNVVVEEIVRNSDSNVGSRADFAQNIVADSHNVVLEEAAAIEIGDANSLEIGSGMNGFAVVVGD
jgi:hypothetical protein